jgi:hypothetical protein
MSDNELLGADERQRKIAKFVGDLSDRFSESFWKNPEKTERIKRIKPSLLEEFNDRWDELDKRCSEYLRGEIEWAGDSMQMEFTPLAKAPYPVLVVERDVENYGRDLFVWFTLQAKDL